MDFYIIFYSSGIYPGVNAPLSTEDSYSTSYNSPAKSSDIRCSLVYFEKYMSYFLHV